MRIGGVAGEITTLDTNDGVLIVESMGIKTFLAIIKSKEKFYKEKKE